MAITSNMFLSTINMFLFLMVELTILFLTISYIVGILQLYIPPSKIQSLLSGRKGKGYLIAGLLGAITPFCSCSTIPFLKGLLRANAGFGPMMVFLFASPLLNPIIIALFVVTFGLKIAISYFIIAMTVSIIAGYVLKSLNFEKYIKKTAYIQSTTSACSNSAGSSSCDGSAGSNSAMVKKINKWKKIWLTTYKDFQSVLPYLFAGITLGAIIYGFIPTEFIAKIAGENNPLAIPVAAIIGIPLYIRAEAVIPLSAMLATKGMSLGAVIALIIGSAGASLTELILLKSIFKNPMIIAFVVVIITMAIFSGYFYHYLF